MCAVTMGCTFSHTYNVMNTKNTACYICIVVDTNNIMVEWSDTVPGKPADVPPPPIQSASRPTDLGMCVDFGAVD